MQVSDVLLILEVGGLLENQMGMVMRLGVVTRLGVANGNEIEQAAFCLINMLVKICHIYSGKTNNIFDNYI